MARTPEDAESRPAGVEDAETEQGYRYIPPEEVTRIFEHFGYGSSKRYVGAAYVSEDGKKVVGVLKVTEEQCEGHFVHEKVFRGVDQIEAFGQSWLVAQFAIGNIPESLGPLFASTTAQFKNPVQPGAVLNMYVERVGTDPNSNIFSARGRTLSGDVLISEMEVSGAMLPTAILPRLIARSARQQGSTPPKFTIKE